MENERTSYSTLSPEQFTDLLHRARRRRRVRRGWQLSLTAMFAIVVAGGGVAIVTAGRTSGPVATDSSTTSAPDLGGSYTFESGPSIELRHSCSANGETWDVTVNNTSDAPVVVQAIEVTGAANLVLQDEDLTLDPGATRSFSGTVEVFDGGSYTFEVTYGVGGYSHTDFVERCTAGQQ